MIFTTRVTALAFLLCCSLVSESFAQTDSSDVRRLEGKHGLSLSMGLLGSRVAEPGRAAAEGMLGGLAYQYWASPVLGIEVSGDVHDAEARAGGTSTAVLSLLFGANWYPSKLTIASAIRPYVGAALGPYIASEANGPLARAATRTVLGARLGGGIDAFPASWLRLGFRSAYHVTPEFEQPVGTLKSARGAQFSFELGLLFGGR